MDYSQIPKFNVQESRSGYESVEAYYGCGKYLNPQCYIRLSYLSNPVFCWFPSFRWPCKPDILFIDPAIFGPLISGGGMLKLEYGVVLEGGGEMV